MESASLLPYSDADAPKRTPVDALPGPDRFGKPSPAPMGFREEFRWCRTQGDGATEGRGGPGPSSAPEIGATVGGGEMEEICEEEWANLGVPITAPVGRSQLHFLGGLLGADISLLEVIAPCSHDERWIGI